MIVIINEYELAFEQNLLKEIIHSPEKEFQFVSDILQKLLYYFFERNEDLIFSKTFLSKSLQENIFFSITSENKIDILDQKMNLIRESIALIKLLFN
jgi:hypothetical protein